MVVFFLLSMTARRIAPVPTTTITDHGVHGIVNTGRFGGVIAVRNKPS